MSSTFSLLRAASPYSRSPWAILPDVRSLGGSAAAMIACWMEAYSLADENAASARVRLIISGLLVACAMSWDRLRSERMRRLYASTVTELETSFLYALPRIEWSSVTCEAIWLTFCRMLRSASSLSEEDLLGGGEEGLELQVRLPARVGDLVVADRAVVGQRAGGVVALGLEGLGEVRRLTGQLGEELHVVELLHVLERLVDADAAQGGGRDHGEGEERDQARGDAPVAEGYSGADLVLGLGRGGGRRLGRRGRGARATAAVTALAGRSLTLVRGVRGRGTAVGPGTRFLLRRSIRSALAGLGRPRAIPLETSLH